MGARVEVREGERLAEALKRLRKMIQPQLYWLRKREARLVTPSESRRWREGAKKAAVRRAMRKRRRELGLG
jgi:ribosomal protein S21